MASGGPTGMLSSWVGHNGVLHGEPVRGRWAGLGSNIDKKMSKVKKLGICSNIWGILWEDMKPLDELEGVVRDEEGCGK